MRTWLHCSRAVAATVSLGGSERRRQRASPDERVKKHIISTSTTEAVETRLLILYTRRLDCRPLSQPGFRLQGSCRGRTLLSAGQLLQGASDMQTELDMAGHTF